MDAPERIWAFNAKQTGYRFYANGPQPEFDNVEFRRADLCADPALLAEAVAALWWISQNAALTRRENIQKVADAFIAKWENRHDR